MKKQPYPFLLNQKTSTHIQVLVFRYCAALTPWFQEKVKKKPRNRFYSQNIFVHLQGNY